MFPPTAAAMSSGLVDWCPGCVATWGGAQFSKRRSRRATWPRGYATSQSRSSGGVATGSGQGAGGGRGNPQRNALK